MKEPYLFCSERLGFRVWNEADTLPFLALNQDAEVMRFFPKTLNLEEVRAFIIRMQELYAQKGYCYFAVEELQTQHFIGCIGLADQTFEAPFTPCVDIGWRLAKEFWNKGYATEGAKRCLDYAFQVLELKQIVALCPQCNLPSERVMQKIGLQKVGTFQHSKLLDFAHLVDCVWYEGRMY